MLNVNRPSRSFAGDITRGPEVDGQKQAVRRRILGPHNGSRIGPHDAKGRIGLAQYIIRNPFFNGLYHPETDMVIHHSAMIHGKARQNFLVVPAAEFIARTTQHLPDKGFPDGALLLPPTSHVLP